MTLLLAIGAGVILTAIAVVIGGFVLESILTAIDRSLKRSQQSAPFPTGRLVNDLHRTDNNIGVMDWRGGKVAA